MLDPNLLARKNLVSCPSLDWHDDTCLKVKNKILLFKLGNSIFYMCVCVFSLCKAKTDYSSQIYTTPTILLVLYTNVEDFSWPCSLSKLYLLRRKLSFKVKYL